MYVSSGQIADFISYSMYDMAPERSVFSYSLISYNHMFILDILVL